jgi:hypothetical protein
MRPPRTFCGRPAGSGPPSEHSCVDLPGYARKCSSWDAHVIACSIVLPGSCSPKAINARADFVGTGRFSIGPAQHRGQDGPRDQRSRLASGPVGWVGRCRLADGAGCLRPQVPGGRRVHGQPLDLRGAVTVVGGGGPEGESPIPGASSLGGSASLLRERTAGPKSLARGRSCQCGAST